MTIPDPSGNYSSLLSHEARTSLQDCVSSRRRTWLFVPGLDRAAQRRGLDSGADVLVADLEELTAPADRQAACIRVVDFLAECRLAGVVAAVRINALEHGGQNELEKIIEGGPDAVLTSQTHAARYIEELDVLLEACEGRLQLRRGRTAIVPVLTSPMAIVRTFDVLTASPRIKAAVLSGERLGVALGMENPGDAIALRHIRSRFIVECAAAGCLAVDTGHTYPDARSMEDDIAWARGAGLKSKQAAFCGQVTALNRVLSPPTQKQENPHESPE